MTEILYNTRLISRLLEKMRKARAHFLLSKVKTWPGMKILDVGCGPDGRSFENHVSRDYTIVGIDIIDPESLTVQHPNFRYFRQDARDLSIFSKKSFDLAVSIGMIEHICERRLLEQMVIEIKRVSKQWVIVVPFRYCWIEPHFKFPFFQLLPEYLQVHLTRIFNLHGLREAVSCDPNWIREHYQWLTTAEWQRIFGSDKTHVFMGIYLLVVSSLS